METVLEKFPFLTVCKYLEHEYLGIIASSDSLITSMYVYSDFMTYDLKKIFLELGDEWWWQTNRLLPINIVLKSRWEPFKPFIKSFATKELEIISGPCVSLDAFMNKRIKRRQIQLIKRMD